jgi:hypothetical protein
MEGFMVKYLNSFVDVETGIEWRIPFWALAESISQLEAEKATVLSFMGS